MIATAGWFNASTCGFIATDGQSHCQASPDSALAGEMAGLVGQPVKYHSRMTFEARACLCAASLAMCAAGWPGGAVREIGAIATGYSGWVEATRRYFDDYLQNGRTLGRGNLFIYTLPTSVLGEIAIPLRLDGPIMHIHTNGRPVEGIVRHAQRLVEDQEADAMLAILSNPDGAVCFAVGPAKRGLPPLPPDYLEADPLALASHLAGIARKELLVP